MNAQRGLGIIAATVVAAASLTAVAASALAVPARGPVSRVPRIVARPAVVLVNRHTELSGSGFAAHRRIVIWECSTRHWVVPAQVCNHRNAVHVTTGRTGAFRVSFKALVCPVRNHALATGLARVCFVGEPAVRGVDTVVLLGAARITVTGP